jgi:threonine dehydrogenase-like Zn-dependent dehydrogenase
MELEGDSQVDVLLERKSCSEEALKSCSPFGVGRVVSSHPKDLASPNRGHVLVRIAGSEGSEIAVKKTDCIPIPDDLDVHLAIWIPALAFALWIWEKLSLELGEVAVYSGGTFLSELVGQVALRRGGCPVIRLGNHVSEDLHPGIETLSLQDPELAVEKLKQRIAGKTGFAAVDLSGLPEIIDLILEALPRWGRVMLLGFESRPVTIDFYKNVHYKGAVILSGVFDPSLVFAQDPELVAQLPRAIRILRSVPVGQNLLASLGCYS